MLHRHDEYVTYIYAQNSYATKQRLDDAFSSIRILREQIKDLEKLIKNPPVSIPPKDPSLSRDNV